MHRARPSASKPRSATPKNGRCLRTAAHRVSAAAKRCAVQNFYCTASQRQVFSVFCTLSLAFPYCTRQMGMLFRVSCGASSDLVSGPALTAACRSRFFCSSRAL
ncbi:hypothetical protein V5799_019875 [Amblyomma americanum]|uniref:Uncharacterized protein n=1 Tax=Amblyomma americanum TaxID=6943 RepID=A0AAQ4EVN8_AMBAM